MKQRLLILAGLIFWTSQAVAGGYDEFYVEAMSAKAVDPAVQVLRLAAFTAARNGDLDTLQTMFAENVAIYTASQDPDDMAADEFKAVERVPRDKIVARIAGQVVDVSKVSEKQLLRSGFFATAALLRDPEVGVNGKMAGMICNRPVNRPKLEKFKAARLATKSRIANWVVAKQDMGPSDVADAPGQYPTKIYKDQMVLKTTESHSDRRWTSIAALDGGESLYYKNPQSYSIAPYFAQYVAEHVCFGKQNSQWKITAIALRVP